MIQFFLTLRRLASAVVSAWRRDPQFRSLTFLVAFTLLSGTLFYRTVEGWSIVDAFYFSVTTLTTVGLGDLAPVHHVRQALHGGLHLRRVGPHRWVHQHRCPRTLSSRRRGRSSGEDDQDALGV